MPSIAPRYDACSLLPNPRSLCECKYSDLLGLISPVIPNLNSPNERHCSDLPGLVSLNIPESAYRAHDLPGLVSLNTPESAYRAHDLPGLVSHNTPESAHYAPQLLHDLLGLINPHTPENALHAPQIQTDLPGLISLPLSERAYPGPPYLLSCGNGNTCLSHLSHTFFGCPPCRHNVDPHHRRCDAHHPGFLPEHDSLKFFPPTDYGVP